MSQFWTIDNVTVAPFHLHSVSHRPPPITPCRAFGRSSGAALGTAVREHPATLPPHSRSSRGSSAPSTTSPRRPITPSLLSGRHHLLLSLPSSTSRRVFTRSSGPRLALCCPSVWGSSGRPATSPSPLVAHRPSQATPLCYTLWDLVCCFYLVLCASGCARGPHRLVLNPRDDSSNGDSMARHGSSSDGDATARRRQRRRGRLRRWR